LPAKKLQSWLAADILEDTFMEQTTTQNPANPGASNAADFQPGTQNPQEAPAQLFSQPGSVQSGSQDTLLENKNAHITVTSQPAASTPAVAQAKSGNGEVIFAILVAALVVAFLLWRRRRQQTSVVEEIVETAETIVVEIPATIPPAASKKPATKKAAPKKSKSQRKKRARR
jgi:MYXO-CTERM domain-containing protein